MSCSRSIARGRERKCKSCRGAFKPRNSLHIVCSPTCAINHGRKREERRLRKERQVCRQLTREQRAKLLTRRDWLKKAQVAFNRYIRLRDRDMPCICCGRPLGERRHGGSYDAGHYRSVGSAPHLRFHPDNCHAQLKVCNRFGSGRAVNYRIGLIARIGIDRVEALEADQRPRKHTIEELREIQIEYMHRARELSRLNPAEGSSKFQGECQ